MRETLLGRAAERLFELQRFMDAQLSAMSVRLTSGFVLVLMISCAPSIHEARTAAELADEIQVVAAVLRWHRTPPDPARAICLSRRLEGRPNMPSLPSSSLAEAENYMMEHSDDADELIPPRNIDDGAIVGIIDHAEPGPSCTGIVFISFSRVLFRGDTAIVWQSGTTSCTRVGQAIRLRREANSWRIVERGPQSYSSETDCGGEQSATRAGFIKVRG
jgi:hypothetical protein